MDIMRTHPMVIIGGILQENPFFVPPDEMLRELREHAGRPSYRQLAQLAHYSHTALSQAAAGRCLPSLAVTQAFVRACGLVRNFYAQHAGIPGRLPG